MSAVFKGIGVLGLAAAIIIPIALWQGFVIHLLWRWFVVPIGLPEIGILHAIGLSMFVAVFKPVDRSKRDDKDEFWFRLAERVGGQVLVLAIAYAVKSGMS